jgi:hypothetical protein
VGQAALIGMGDQICGRGCAAIALNDRTDIRRWHRGRGRAALIGEGDGSDR